MFIWGETEINEDLIVRVSNGSAYFESAIHFMDEDIREEMYWQCYEFENEQAFVDEYMRRHEEKFGEEFGL